jgi:GDP/UDP-N,N'-diacetylbacillosamine 2-epimerase (hydrolysing)
MKRKKVLAITGIRSEYDILYPIINRLRRDRNFEVKVVACGAHLSDWHGLTLKKIKEDGFIIADKIDYLLMTNRKTQRAKGMGILTYALTQTVDRENPDFLLVIGDREEAIATAVVGNYLDVLVAHVGGGDPAFSNADDPMRFAVSKLAHIHFTMAKPYANNLVKVGEEKFRVFFTGNPSYENIKNIPSISLAKISKFLNFDITNTPYITIIKHPLSSQKEESAHQMKVTLQAVKEFCQANGVKAVGIYPNTDPGAADIVKAIETYRNDPHVRFHKTLPREIFVNLMRNASALIGNSSMGILEAPFYRLPAVNVGNRQKGRLNAGNVEFVGYNIPVIKKALSKACFDKKYRQKVRGLTNPYGDANAAEKIRKILSGINFNDQKWYIKRSLC